MNAPIEKMMMPHLSTSPHSHGVCVTCSVSLALDLVTDALALEVVLRLLLPDALNGLTPTVVRL